MQGSIGRMFSPLVSAIETSRFNLNQCKCLYEAARADQERGLQSVEWAF